MSYYIYGVAHEERSGLDAPVKIGITGNLDGRLSAIRTGSPRRICLAFALNTRVKQTALVIEAAAHKHFSDRALEGEWFDVTPLEVAIFLTGALEGYLMTGFAHEGWRLSELRAELEACGVRHLQQRIAAARYIEAWQGIE